MRTRLGVVVSALAVTAACSSTPSGKPATDASNSSSTKSAEAAATSSGTELPKFKEIVVPAGDDVEPDAGNSGVIRRKPA